MAWVTRPVAGFRHLYRIHVKKVHDMIVCKFMDIKTRCSLKEIEALGMPRNQCVVILKSIMSLGQLYKYTPKQANYSETCKEILGDDYSLEAELALRAKMKELIAKTLLEIRIELAEMNEQYEKLVDLRYKGDGTMDLAYEREHQRLASSDYKSKERLENRLKDRQAAGLAYKPEGNK